MNILYCTILYLLLCITQVYNVQADDAQESMSKAYYEQLCTPIEFTKSGIITFLGTTYNKPAYTEVLPNNFSHVIQFLEHGQKTKQSRSYAQSVLRLFSNKEKACTYINADSYCFLLERMPTLMQPYFTVHKSDRRTYLHQELNSLLHTAFSQKFSHFKSDPTSFLQNLSLELLEILYTEHTDDVQAESLRKTLLIFLDAGLGKLVWSPVDTTNTWESVKNISRNLAACKENGILDDAEDLNGLFITLIERYCFFLDIVCVDLPLSFYQQVKADIAQSTDMLLTLEEEQGEIETKKERLVRALDCGEAQVRAYGYMQAQQQSGTKKQ